MPSRNPTESDDSAGTRSRRSEIRKARYDLAISLGYSTTEARAMRDRSAETIRANVQSTRLMLERTDITRRPPETVERLRTLRQWQREQTSDVGSSRVNITPKRTREDEWSLWSSKDHGFPTAILDEIDLYNAAAGEPEFSSHGFRVMYARYVLGYDEDDALEFAEYVEDSVI